MIAQIQFFQILNKITSSNKYLLLQISKCPLLIILFKQLILSFSYNQRKISNSLFICLFKFKTLYKNT